MRRVLLTLAVLLLLGSVVQSQNVSSPLPVQDAATSATGSAVPAKAHYIAGNASGNLLGAIFCDQNKAVSISTAATTVVIALTAGKTTYICSWDFFAAGADNVAFVYGTGTTCGTGTTAIIGGTTAATGYNFTAQTGISKTLPTGTAIKEASANDTCIITSAAVQLSGSIQYAQF